MASSYPRRRSATLAAGLLATVVGGALLVPAAGAAPSTGAATAAPAATAPTALPQSPTATTQSVGGLTLTNSFVSDVGWVKPGEAYPSRLLLTNTTELPVDGATVTATAPRGTSFTDARTGTGTATQSATEVTWTVPTVPANRTVQLVLSHEADTLTEEPTLVWRDLSTTATLTIGSASASVDSHGPKVIPPGGAYDTARYGDRPFPVVPVAYLDRDYQPGHTGDVLDRVVNDPDHEGSTFNLYQEMSLGQLYPHGTVPSAGVDRADFAYGPGFDFRGISDTEPTNLSTCTGATVADSPIPAEGTALYPDRIRDGVYQLPGMTQYYGQDGNGSALVGALTGSAALMQIDSGCGPTGKLVWDAAAIADPEIDYSDYDTDKDGVVDFFMVVFAGCGGHGASQLSVAGCPYPDAPYDNVWPHSSSLEYYFTDPETGLPGFTTDDQLKDLEGRKLYYTSEARTEMTTDETAWPVYVRVGPYNVNPEDSIDHASVISHEYGHSLGLPDFYSLGSRETYGTWNLMASDHSQNMDIFSRQELGWVVPEVLEPGTAPSVTAWQDSKEDIDTIHWQSPDGTPYTLTEGTDGRVQNSQAYVAKLPGRVLLDPAAFETGEGATPTHTWWSNSGNDFGCVTDGKGHNIDLYVPGVEDLPADSTVELTFKSRFDIEWDYDYGFVLTSVDGGREWSSQPSERETPTTTASSNPNQNGCQAALGNGITGSSASYTDPVTVQVDRTTGTYPPAEFISDSFDVSELAGADLPVLRFSYSSDPGLARPGWFIDDLKVTATLPDGTTRELMATDFESDGGPDDPRVFNGGCQGDGPGGNCTHGWTFVEAGAEAAYDHAYYLELRDRSGFDLDGNGQSDRGEVDWAPGLSLVYTDEAHGYGNVGTDNPPAQSPLDSQPEPGSDTPDLSDAAWTAADGDSRFSDSGDGHVDNYTDAEGGDWLFDHECLTFDVAAMRGAENGPQESDGDLEADVDFTVGDGCGAFDYAYGDPPPAGEDTAPTAVAEVAKRRIKGTPFRLYGDGSTDAETPLAELTYEWDFHDGGSTVDSTEANPQVTYGTPGPHSATLTVTDEAGNEDTATVDFVVWRTVGCATPAVERTGSWRRVEQEGLGAERDDYCDNKGRRAGPDTQTLTVRGPEFGLSFGTAKDGGVAVVRIDGERVGRISFAGSTQRPRFPVYQWFGGNGTGQHTVTLIVREGTAYVDRYVTRP